MKYCIIGEKEDPKSTMCISNLKYTALELELKYLLLSKNYKKIIIKVED